MRIKDQLDNWNNTSPGRKTDGREAGEPHPDAHRNYQYADKKLKNFEPTNGMRVSYQDKDHRTELINPISVIFSWTQGKQNHGNPISFHQEHSAFIKTFDSAIGWCFEKGFAKRPW